MGCYVRKGLYSIQQIDAELSLLPSLQIGYTKTALAHTPHGSDQNSKKQSSTTSLENMALQILPFSTEVVADQLIQLNSGKSQSYKNHPFMKSVTNLDAGEIRLLSYVVDDCFGYAVYNTRNKDVGSKKINKCLRFGVGQKQHTSNKRYRRYFFHQHS